MGSELWRHIRNGVRYGYPLCCVLRWSLTRVLLGPRAQATQRGVCTVNGEPSRTYVPCGVLHRP